MKTQSFSVLRSLQQILSNFYSYTDLVVQQFKMLQAESTQDMEKLTSTSYWNAVSKINNIHNEPKYAEVAKMSMAFMCLNHGNATPERGFSENKAVLNHRESLDEDTIIAIRITKDFLKHTDLTKFEVNRRLLTLCGHARKKYGEFLDQQKIEEETKQKLKLANDANKRQKEEKNKVDEKVREIDRSIAEENGRLRVAEGLLKESNQELMSLINSREAVKKTVLIHTQMVLDTAIKNIDGIKINLNRLNQEKSDLLKKKK